MGLSASTGSINIKDRAGVVKLDLSTRRPVVLQRVQGNLSATAPIYIEYKNSDGKPSTVETGSRFAVTPIYSSSKLISQGVNPDFLLVKARIVTNRESRQVSASGSCIASLGLATMGLRDGSNNVIGGPTNYVINYDALDDAATCVFHIYIENGNVYIQIETAPNWVDTGNMNEATYINHANWLVYTGSPNPGYSEYIYNYNVRIEYDVTLMKFMGE